MRIRVLGAHNLETADTRHTCFLVNENLAIDAGSLMTSLSSEEKDSLTAVLLTHRHFDHLRDLPSLGLATQDNGITVGLYGLSETLDALSSHLMDGLLYPNFMQRPTLEHPKYRLNSVASEQVFTVAGLDAKAIAVPHSAPAVGFILRSDRGAIAFTGDTGGGLEPFLLDSFKPSLLFVEVTFSSVEEDRARNAGHLTPSLLRGELAAALGRGTSIPRIIAVHMDQRHEGAIRRELVEVSADLGVEIIPATEDMEFQV